MSDEQKQIKGVVFVNKSGETVCKFSAPTPQPKKVHLTNCQCLGCRMSRALGLKE